jgi:2'-5' RNA ligase
MSLFVAVFPPEPVRVDLERRLAGLRVTAAAAGGRRVRRTPPGKWHVTLAFLGELPDARVADVEDAVGRAVQTPRSPVVRLAGGGSFGRGRSAVLWVGVAGDLAGLGDLHQDLRQSLEGAGLPSEDRPFTPHLTVAYPGEKFEPSHLRADRDDLAGYAGPEWRVDEVVLVRSRAGTYEPVRTWRW